MKACASRKGNRMTTYFCDGLKEVTIVNGVARLEFHRLQAGGTLGPNRDQSGNCWGDNASFICGGGV